MRPDRVAFPAGFTAEDAGESDLEDLIDLLDAFFSEQSAMDHGVAPASDWRDRASGWLLHFTGDPESFVRIARREGEPAGFVIFCVQQEPMLRHARQGVILDLFVRPDMRRRGPGTALGQLALWCLRDLQVDLIHLNVLSANEDAIRFWERLGFTEQMLRMQITGRNPDATALRAARKPW